MRYGSVCSGIESATVAWGPLGWEPAWFAEIARFPSAVLSCRFPEVSNLGDFTRITGNPSGPIDLLVGGTPCQSFSVGGRRAGLDDPRGVLALQYLRLADLLRPPWLVFENVPGLLSSGGGRDLATFLGAMARIGYGWSYRVLDARFFGCACARPRLYVVGYLGDWRPPAAVLVERESVAGYRTTPGRKATIRTAPVLTRRGALALDDRTACVLEPFGPRLATPLEWERALGFPDRHTDIPGARDRSRYEALGNAMAIPVIRWIGQRIDFIHHLDFNSIDS